MKPLSVGVIGFGRIGKVHAENLVYRIPGATVKTVYTSKKENHSSLDQLGISKITDKPEKVIQDSDVEAIIICSPTPTHFEFIAAAAKAGKHIFCEKPVDMTVEKIEAIQSIIDTYKVKLQVGFNQRFDPNFMAVRQTVASGKIGDPQILKITSRDPGPPPLEYLRSSGGMFMDMSIHDFDMARFIVGSEVKEVYARAETLVDSRIKEVGDVDTAIITLSFENGCLGVIDNSRKAIYGYDQRLEIMGSKGMSQVSNNHPNTQIFYDEQGGHRGLPYNFFMDRYTQSYCNQLNAFVESVRTNQPVAINNHDALMATKIALAAQASITQNKPIQL